MSEEDETDREHEQDEHEKDDKDGCQGCSETIVREVTEIERKYGFIADWEKMVEMLNSEEFKAIPYPECWEWLIVNCAIWSPGSQLCKYFTRKQFFLLVDEYLKEGLSVKEAIEKAIEEYEHKDALEKCMGLKVEVKSSDKPAEKRD